MIFGFKKIAFCCLCLILSSTVICAQQEPQRIIVDNFERPGKQNALGGDYGAFADPQARGNCYLFIFENKENDRPNSGKYALYIEWDTSREGAYAGYWSDLKHLNLQRFNTLTFSVKGLKGGEIFKVGLRGPRGQEYETKIDVGKALKRGVTADWQRVNIPLKWFGAVQEWDDVNIFSINFENAIGSSKGAILVDDIAFER